MTQDELHIKAGVSLPAVRRMEMGEGVLATTAKLVAGALGVRVEDIEGVNVVHRMVRK